MSWAFQLSASGAPGGTVEKKAFGTLIVMNAAQYVSAIDSEKKDRPPTTLESSLSSTEAEDEQAVDPLPKPFNLTVK
ncbi:hypothetical protein EC957_012373 [Mortierella hygrophila]|uniref:Uncharacterized protein n=1 Tax=Mortierella hygrophila TaxID=979708 RepID=A0A9P6F810_9FUNG|nr:hypothetical protein EC957_012373 [Mortierella hygrophila]